MNKTYHTPVLLKESIEFLNIRPGKTYVDATLGGGGHSEEILKALKGKGRLIGIDQDDDALNYSKDRLSKFKNITFIKDNFANIKEISRSLRIEKIDGVLLDLGISSYQIDNPERGFSLRNDGPLDMRMDKNKELSAKDIINSYSLDEITHIIKSFGEDRKARRIAKFIVKEREKKPILRTIRLADIIKYAAGPGSPKSKLDSVTRTFQALRIVVNDELNKLSSAINDAIDCLSNKGRLVIISYHSLEDRIVKTIFKNMAKDCVCPKEVPVCICNHIKKIKILTKKPIMATEKEIENNPRSRSAKLRAAERII